MKGDFSRDTFDSLKHFSRVLSQQGRVTLDADPNEQTAILLHYVRTLARDLIGPHAAPEDNAGFSLRSSTNGLNLVIGQGRYYVDGILVENEQDCLYYLPEDKTSASDNSLPVQPDYPVPQNDPFVVELRSTNTTQSFWFYLEVWERHVTPIEDDSIREKALDGPHTCTRAKIVWQVKSMATADIETRLKLLLERLQARDKNSGSPELEARIKQLTKDIQSFQNSLGEPAVSPFGCPLPLDLFGAVSDAWMGARIDPGVATTDACITPPASNYRGTENQLYRVEIHRGGDATNATFKWSRDNGSIVTAWLNTSGNDIQVANARDFSSGNWVELSDDTQELLGLPGTLVKIVKVDGDVLTADASTAPPPWSATLVHPKVRRWDQIQTETIVLANDNALPVKETPVGTSADKVVWLDLEDGVQIQFAAGGVYRTGDYWLIPARVAGGGIEWPLGDGDLPPALPPRGIERHYAPLGFVWMGDGSLQIQTCGCTFPPQNNCAAVFQTDSKRVPAPEGPRIPTRGAARPAPVRSKPKRPTQHKPVPRIPTPPTPPPNG